MIKLTQDILRLGPLAGVGVQMLMAKYKPYINYDWSTTTTSGLRYLKDVGSTPTYNASMYFGRGAYLNGVDQTITVPINATIQTALKRVNGIVTINETSQTLTNYVISGLGVHKDYYLFTRLLTTAEKDSYTNTPELFYAMAQADSTCVLNMPMCETDGYARNMKSYSENTKLSETFNDNLAGWTTQSGWTIPSDGFAHYDFNISSSKADLSISTNIVIGNTYLVEVDISSVANGGYINLYNNGVFYRFINGGNKIGKDYLMFKAVSTPFIIVGWAGQVDVSAILVKQLTGIYPITNYTTSVRDNAKNLQYGLQTCKFVRDSLGVIQSGSNYLECDGVGYGDTGWIPNSTNDFSIELVRYCSAEAKIDGDGTIVVNNSGVNILLTYPTMFLQIGTIITGTGHIGGIISNTYNYFVVTYNKNTKIVSLYLNGIYIKKYTTDFITGSNTYKIGKTQYNFLSKNARKVVKVHNKVLTQAEITANYNDYVSKGLLA